MTKESTDKLSSLLTSPVTKALGAAFLLGFSAHQFESKFDEFGDRVIKKIDEHIISDKFEKQMLQNELSQLRSMVEDVQDQVSQINPNAFVRPDEVRIQTKRRR